jgi:hypothetical protein
MKMRQVVGVLALVGVGVFLIPVASNDSRESKGRSKFRERKIFRKMV